MSYENIRIAGSRGCGIVTGTTKFSAPSGKLIASIVVRSAGATIDTAEDENGDTVTGETWLDVALTEGEIITIETGLSSVTLTNATDSIMMYYVADEIG